MAKMVRAMMVFNAMAEILVVATEGNSGT